MRTSGSLQRRLGAADSFRRQTLFSPRGATALLAVFMLGGVVSLLKGDGPAIINDVEFYWMVDYGHGFIRRGLVGTLFHPLVASTSSEFVTSVVPGIHLAACLLILYFCARLFAGAVDREAPLIGKITLSLSFLLLMCSPLLSTLGYMVGYLDPFTILLAVGAMVLVLQGRYGAAGALACVGPLVHESFLFLWAPVAVMLLWSCARSPQDRARKCCAAVLPMLSALIVVGLHDQSAAKLVIDSLPLSDVAKSKAVFQLGLTFRASFEHMQRYEYPGHAGNVIVAMVYFLVPAVGLLWAAAFLNWKRWAPYSGTTLLVAIVATAAPLTLLLLAWDLSRFLVWATLAAAFALAGSNSPRLLAPQAPDRG